VGRWYASRDADGGMVTWRASAPCPADNGTVKKTLALIADVGALAVRRNRIHLGALNHWQAV
jgi:hypothetical protein